MLHPIEIKLLILKFMLEEKYYLLLHLFELIHSDVLLLKEILTWKW